MEQLEVWTHLVVEIPSFIKNKKSFLSQDICTHAHVMAEHSAWDGEKTVIITCRWKDSIFKLQKK